MRTFLIYLLLPILVFAQVTERKSPEEIEQELDAAESEFKRAKEMFNPWYTGPLITPSASMMPPASGNTQPYLFFTENYAAFDKHRKSVKLPSSLFQIQFSDNILTGVTDNMDFNLAISAFGNWQNGRSGGGIGDLSLQGGFLIYRQTPYIPGMKFIVQQTLPTGKYDNLKKGGLDGVGGGTYSTQFGFAISKIILWATKHPMNLRWFVGYKIGTSVEVHGINTYGGGAGCKGHIVPGHQFSTDLGYELSLSQRWVLALDLVYSLTNQTKFHGYPGRTDTGALASIGSGYSDNFSLAPAIEYNFSPNLGLLVGGWFSVYGRNSTNYGSGIISLSYSFP